jgi:hypothetical protein
MVVRAILLSIIASLPRMSAGMSLGVVLQEEKARNKSPGRVRRSSCENFGMAIFGKRQSRSVCAYGGLCLMEAENARSGHIATPVYR